MSEGNPKVAVRGVPSTEVYASITRRFMALLLDGLILAIPHLVFNHLLPVLGSVFVVVLYAPVLESSELRATIGKHLMGIQVTDTSGARISFWAALIRTFMKFVSSVIFCLGYVIAFFTERRQALHDLVAETIVVYGRSERGIPDAWLAQLKSIFQSSEAAFKGTSSASQIVELERLQGLRERGALTEEEFQREKRRILGE